MTELEGGILGILRRKPGMTAYAVRQVFLGSLSLEWSGSAGAVYPAMARLVKGGLLRARMGNDRRGTQTYAVTARGEKASDAWLCDVERTMSPGLDPFRSRSSLWHLLATGERRRLMLALKKTIEQRRGELEPLLATLEPPDATMLEMHLALLDLRLAWLSSQAV
jgi:DNA-binding PadR family transcriptional regulator